MSLWDQFRSGEEGFIPDDTVAIDATHIEARDRAPKKQEQQKERTAPKKRGRKPKQEREVWLLQKQQEEEQKSIYEKKIADQLDVPYKTLREQMPIAPELVWLQRPPHSGNASGSMNDGKAAIPLLKGLQAQFPTYRFSYATMDAGYDYEPI